jgi:hypothetical protein
MAAVAITPIAQSTSGYNLTDSTDFETLVAGAGNGVSAPYNDTRLLLLKNTTGGPATFTILLKTISILSDLSITPDDFELVAADGKTYMLKPSDAMNDAGTLTIECDVAGEVLALSR